MAELVVISGAGGGIGKATALRLADAGFTVIAGIRKPQDGEALMAAVTNPQRMLPTVFDVTNDNQLGTAVELVRQHVKNGDRLAAVFSNAGIGGYSGDTSCEGLPNDHLERMINVDFIGATKFIRAFLPLLRESKGRVLVNTAMMARIVLPFSGGYAPAKGALEVWCTSLRREIAPHGVKVIMIEYAEIDSDLAAKQDTDSVQASGPYPGQKVIADFFASSKGKVPKPGSKTSVEAAAEVVYRALIASNPRLRYIGGGGAHALALLSRAPQRFQDFVLAKMIETGLRKLNIQQDPTIQANAPTSA